MSKKLIALLLCLCMALACIPAVCASGADSLEDALAAAKPGTTVTLQEDTTAARVVVPKGVLLDLNGHTLTSDFFVVVNGQLFDSTNSTGKIVIPQDMLTIVGDNNGVLPVWDPNENCFVLAKATYQQMMRPAADNSYAQYIFIPNFDSKTVALLADGGADNGVAITVQLSWNNGACKQTYTFSEDMVKQVYSSFRNGVAGKVFQLTISGIAGISDMKISAVAESTAGGAIRSTAQLLDASIKYTVTFKDWDGTVLKTESVASGKAATAPAEPTRAGYTFSGWDKAFDNITGDLEVNATYTKASGPSLIVGNETAAAGDTRIDLMVEIENNPGVVGLTVRMEYDDTVLTATRAGTELAFDELSFQKPAKYKNGCKLIFYAAEVEEVLDGEAFYIRFNVSEDAAPGTYPVKLIVEQVLNEKSEDVELFVVDGSIIVE